MLMCRALSGSMVECRWAVATHQRDEDLANAKDQDPEADAEGRARVVQMVDPEPAQPHMLRDELISDCDNIS